MKKVLFIMMFIILSTSCDSLYQTDDIKNTYDDDISDITSMNGYFFTTNYDLSGNGGSQIDLLKFNVDNNLLEDSYDLMINGQGYLAITNDGQNIFLQSKETKLVFKVSTIGEKDWIKTDSISLNWQPSGIAYNLENDSLTTLYRNLDNLNEYRLRTLSKDFEQPASRDIIFNILIADKSYNGMYAIEYYNSKLYILGVDTTGTDILMRLNDNELFLELSLEDSLIVGISKIQNSSGSFDDGLYGSFRNKRFEKIFDSE